MQNKKNILKLLRYADHDLPFLENRVQNLSSKAIDLDWKKKRVAKLRKRYDMEIEEKKQIISNLDRQLNQKSEEIQEKLSIQTSK